MKVSARFLLSSVLVFLPTVGFAQYRLYGDCPFPPRGVYTIERDNATILKELEDGQNCLNDGLKEMKSDVENLQSPLRGNDNFKTEILDLQNQLAQTKLDLRIDETRIETLQSSYDRLSRLLDRVLSNRLNNPGGAVRKPTATVSKPKALASKPTSCSVPATLDVLKAKTVASKHKAPV